MRLHRDAYIAKRATFGDPGGGRRRKVARRGAELRLHDGQALVAFLHR